MVKTWKQIVWLQILAPLHKIPGPLDSLPHLFQLGFLTGKLRQKSTVTTTTKILKILPKDDI